MKAGGWHPKFRDYARLFGCRASDLILHTLSVAKTKADRDGWVLCTPRFVFDGLGIDPDAQQRILDKLKAIRVVEIEYRRQGRFVRVDYDKIERLLKDASGQ
jgi:hypothetical protein